MDLNKIMELGLRNRIRIKKTSKRRATVMARAVMRKKTLMRKKAKKLSRASPSNKEHLLQAM